MVPKKINPRKDPLFYKPNEVYTNRTDFNKNDFGDNPVTPKCIDTYILLLGTPEMDVVIKCLEHLVDFLQDALHENTIVLRDKNILEPLLKAKMFFEDKNLTIRADALFLACSVIEKIDMLEDWSTEKIAELADLCVQYYIWECSVEDYARKDIEQVEYLTVILNKCADDPRVVKALLENEVFIEKLFNVIGEAEDPDIYYHSVQLLYKLIQMQSTEEIQKTTSREDFPIDRLICEIDGGYHEERSATLKVIKILVADSSEQGVFGQPDKRVRVVQQLAKSLQNNVLEDDVVGIAQVLATAMRNEKMARIFLEQNLFDRFVKLLEANLADIPKEIMCGISSVFGETAKYAQYLARIHIANVPELLLDCLLQEFIPPTHVVIGLNRIMKFSESAKSIISAFEFGLLPKLMVLMQSSETPIQTREQTAELLESLLVYDFHRTAEELLALKFPELLADIIGLGVHELSIDYLLSLLRIIEDLAQSCEYRTSLAQCQILIRNLALLAKKSFSAPNFIYKIFRCLCTLIEEDDARPILIQNYIASSIRRGLKSSSMQLKSAATNFIMQTSRFNEFVRQYLDDGVFEVLIVDAKQNACVPTWNTATESILSKCPSLKFCIQNHLSFTDSTIGKMFYVSKRRFDDFRVFQNILKEEVSPLFPILCVNFEHTDCPSSLKVNVPLQHFTDSEILTQKDMWTYCRAPGDEYLPQYVTELNRVLNENGLVENPAKIKRCIDFEIVAKRAKILAGIVAQALSADLTPPELSVPDYKKEKCQEDIVKAHLKDLCRDLHCSFIPIGMVRTGCKFERAVLFKGLADQIALPCTLQSSVSGKVLFNEIPMASEPERDIHCNPRHDPVQKWRKLRPTHIIDLMYNVGALYPIESTQALNYLGLY